MNNLRRDLVDLTTQRTARLEAAQAALDAGNQADYDSAMADVRDFNGRIQNIQDLITEQDRQIMAAPAPAGAEARDMAEERGHALMTGHAVTFTADETRRAVMNSITLATGTLVEPTGAGTTIRDPLGNVVSSIVDQVYVQNLTGMGSFLIMGLWGIILAGIVNIFLRNSAMDFAISVIGVIVTTNAGKARTTSADPTFGVAKISPYELNVTQFVDRNISRLSPADYYTKIYNMAMRAMRRNLAGLIVNGDGQASPDMFDIKNAKNVAGAAIAANVDISAIDENLLDTLFFKYGSDEAIGQNARLLLNKADLAAIGKLRNSDKQRVFKINPTAGNPNTGTIEDGGNIVPYTIVSDLTALSASTAGSAAIQTMLYGDPANYELGLFGDYTVRVDDSVKAVARMVTILGDAMVGGNLIVDKGFVIANLPKSGG